MRGAFYFFFGEEKKERYFWLEKTSVNRTISFVWIKRWQKKIIFTEK